MELRQLRYFLAVAEELHFGRAARRVHISQPPLSQQIRQLEEELRVQLFYRTKRHVELTEAGRIFAAEARVILQQVDQAAGLAVEANRSKQNRIIVGFSPANSAIAVRILQVAAKRMPAASWLVKSLVSPQQTEALRNSQIDIGFLTLPAAHDGLVLETIFSEPLVVALPAGHAMARRRRIPLRSLERETLMVFPLYMSPGRYEAIADLCRRAGFSMHSVHEVDNIHTMLEMVRGGFGVSLMRASAKLLNEKGVVFRELQNSPTVETALAWRAGGDQAVITEFVAIARQTAAQLRRRIG